MAIETDRPLYESFNNGVGALSHTWAGNIDRSVGGEIKLTGQSGTMEFPSGKWAGHGYGTYTVNAKIDGNEPGPAILLWPGDDSWPGQEIDLVEVSPNGSGQQYATVHWNDNGNSYEAKTLHGVQSGVFHDYQLVWEPGRMTFKVDGAEKAVFTNHIPADYDNGGMNNVIGVMNDNNNTALTVRSVEYQPLGGGGAPARSEPAAFDGGSPYTLPAGGGAVDWAALAAQVTANHAATGQWFI